MPARLVQLDVSLSDNTDESIRIMFASCENSNEDVILSLKAANKLFTLNNKKIQRQGKLIKPHCRNVWRTMAATI